MKYMLLTSLLCLTSIARADWSLVTINLDNDMRTVERFISYYDCRDRGLKNQSLAGIFGGRAGFYCTLTEAKDGKEDTTIQALPTVD